MSTSSSTPRLSADQLTTLLDMSRTFTTVQSGTQLLRAIIGQAQPLLDFHDIGLFVYDESHSYLEDWATKYADLATSESNRLMHESTVGRVPFTRKTAAVIEKMLTALEEAEEPVIVDMQALFRQYPHFPQSKTLIEFGYRDSMVGLLRIGGETLGFFCVNALKKDFFRSEQFPLFQAVCDQIAIAVSNVLVNEELRQREQEKALEAAVVNVLNEGQGKQEKMFGVAQTLQTHIPFDLIVFSLSEENPEYLGYAFERIGYDEYRTILSDDALRMSELSREEYMRLLRENKYHESLIANAADFEELCRRDGLRAVLARTFGVNSAFILPLRLSRGGQVKRSFQLGFYSREPQGFQESHRRLAHKIQSSLTLAIERQMAYAEIADLNEKLAQEKAYLEEEIKVQYNFGQIIGESPAIQTVFEQIRQVADTDSTVLISGETGTGKELVARALHDASLRRSKALVKINCAALPPQLLESELFGHEKGAFTGAVDRRIGKFELAEKGTIFLDEIGELPLELQSKLLRVLQEREFERVGGNQVLKADVRIVTATNRDLKQEVANGTFRSDLYYRLHVFPIALPPLRDRPEDIPLLATYFVGKLAKKIGKKVTGLTSASLRQLQQYAWPGNIREMEHLLERAVILTKQPELEIALDASAIPLASADSAAVSAPSRVGQTLQDAERELIYNTLLHCQGRIRGDGGAAQMLDINPSTLEARMRKLGLQRKRVVEKIGEQKG